MPVQGPCSWPVDCTLSNEALMYHLCDQNMWLAFTRVAQGGGRALSFSEG